LIVDISRRPAMPPRQDSLPRSAYLVLLALSDRPRHGLAIVDRVEDATHGRMKMGPGTLYGTLQKLEASGMIRETADAPDPDDDDTRRRYYRITPRGERALAAETAALKMLVDAALRR
jgi:DNA-binding PadR family transcriptional regulator